MRKLIIYLIVFLIALSIVNSAYHDNDHPRYLERKGFIETDMYKSGFIDVTWYDGWNGHRVDSTGQADSLLGMEKAIEDSLRYNLVVYIPSGTYLISDTLSIRSNGNNLLGFNGKQCSPKGDIVSVIGNQNDRPLIKLMDNANGFNKKNDPKVAVAVWAWGNVENDGTTNKVCSNAKYNYPIDIRGETFYEFPANGFKMLFKNIDIDVGDRNPGAIGLSFKAAQGATLENVKVNARDSYVGIRDIPTRAAGGAINIEVIGGDYGLMITPSGPTAVLAGGRFSDQKISVLTSEGEGPLVAVGLDIETEDEVPVFKHMSNSYTPSNKGSAVFIDSTIDMKDGGTAFLNNGGRDFHLENVYIKGADTLIDSKGETQSPEGTWSHVREYNFASKDDYKTLTRTNNNNHNWRNAPSWVMIDGDDLNKDTVSDIVSSSDPGIDFVDRHIPELDPFFLDSNVKDAVVDLGIDNTGATDVADDLQDALDRHGKVFLPSGIYKVGKTLNMPKDSSLFAHDYENTRLRTDQDWNPTSYTPIVRTVDDPDGEIFIGGFVFERSFEQLQHSHFGSFELRAGKSVIKKIDSEPFDYHHSNKEIRQTGNRDVVDYRFSGNAGGKFYTIHGGKDHRTNGLNYRRFEMDSTSNPISFYAFNPEHVHSPLFVEINESENIRVFGIKTECVHQFASIEESTNVGFYGFSVACKPTPYTNPNFLVTDSDDVKIVGISARDYKPNSKMLIEEHFGETNIMPHESLISMFKRGDFDSDPFSSGRVISSPSCSYQIRAGASIQSEDYGMPYDPDTNQLEFRGGCSGSRLNVEISSKETSFVYEFGYYWNGDSWVRFTFNGDRFNNLPWFKNSASESLSGLDLEDETYVVAFICDYDFNEEKWKCGCKDSACETSHWNLQIYSDSALIDQ